MWPFFIKRRPTKYQESWSRIVLCKYLRMPAALSGWRHRCYRDLLRFNWALGRSK